MGLDNRPQARAHFRRTAAPVPRDAAPPPVSNVSYAPITVARLYGFPPGTGAGQAIGLIELGGGTRADDLTAYFATFGLTAPKMVTVSVDKGLDQATGSVDGPDGEVMLDVEVAGAVAPGATLVTYFTPNTSAGFIDAVSTAVHDAVNKPSVISISWGSAECNWTGQAMQAMDEAFQAAAAMGVTICVAAGDHGSSDEVADGGNHVDFPASSPHVLACGGTSLQARSGMIVSETVWNDGAGHGATGGGISAVFERPVWQHGLAGTLTAGGTVPLNRRGVPDVSGDADPKTGYQVRVDSSNVIIGGTSAVAPLWAALIARLNEANPGRTAGFINPLLYKNRHALHDMVEGNNGTYAAAPGWDACTGLGSPKGGALAAVVGNHIKTSTNIPMKETKMTEKTHTHEVAKPDGVVFSGNNAIAQPDGVVFSGNSEIAAPNGVVFSGNSEIASPAGVVFSGNDEVATPNGVVFSGNDEPANHS
jgi:kumamolisin